MMENVEGAGTPGDGRVFVTEEVAVAGVPMSYRRSAGPWPTVGFVVVLVHGLGLSGRYMLPAAVCLARRYPVLLPDLPGFGDSAHPPRALDVAGLADALAAWLGTLALPRPVLLGNSFGCQIIADLAARHHDRLACAILQGPTTPPDERSWLRQFVRWRQNQPYNPPALDPITWGDYRKCGYRRLLQTFRYSLQDPVEAKLAQIRCPVLVVRGARDPICRERWAEEVAARIPDGRLVEIPAVAHTLVFTAPAQLAAVTEQFLAEAPGADA